MSEDSSISLYKQIVGEGIDYPVFLWPEWLKLVTGSNELLMIHASLSQDKNAFLPVMASKKWGLKLLTMAPLSPYTDIVFSNDLNDEEKIDLTNKIIKKLNASLCQLSFKPLFKYADILMTNGFRSSTKISYLVDTSLPIDQLESNLKYSVRNKINTLKGQLEFEFEEEAKVFNHLNDLTYKRQGMKLPYPKNLIHDLHHALKEKNKSHILLAKDHDGLHHAGLFLVSDYKNMYCLAIGSNPDLRKSHAVTACIWEAIKLAKSLHLNFDFEGSSLPSVEPFFRRFGGKQIQYRQMTKVSNQYLDFFLQLLYKI